MEPIATFEKVSFDQFKKDCEGCGIGVSAIEETALRWYLDHLKLPSRATEGSAGYDFYMPFDIFSVYSGIQRKIPTGIRCKMNPGWVLMLYPRSGLGFKHGFRLRNTTGIIDSDYYNADNEGHIIACVIADTPIKVFSGDRFMQGVFLPFGTANEEDITQQRTGGFGSTGG